MKNLFLVLTIFCLTVPTTVQADSFETEQDRISYSIGYDIGTNMKRMDIELEIDQFTSGIQAGMGLSDPLLSEEEVMATLMAFQEKMVAERQEVMQQQAQANLKKGQDFLLENKEKEGVITTESGLQYKIIESGDPDGSQPQLTDVITAHYHGTLIDGTVFDSSVERGEPVQFPVNAVISGWTEALQLMHPGDK